MPPCWVQMRSACAFVARRGVMRTAVRIGLTVRLNPGARSPDLSRLPAGKESRRTNLARKALALDELDIFFLLGQNFVLDLRVLAQSRRRPIPRHNLDRRLHLSLMR